MISIILSNTVDTIKKHIYNTVEIENHYQLVFILR